MSADDILDLIDGAIGDASAQIHNWLRDRAALEQDQAAWESREFLGDDDNSFLSPAAWVYWTTSPSVPMRGKAVR